MSAIETYRSMADCEIAEDRVLTQAEIARAAGISLATYRKLPEWDHPFTAWRSDVKRWAAARKRGVK